MTTEEEKNDMTMRLVHEDTDIVSDRNRINSSNGADCKYIFNPPSGEAVYDSHKYESLDIHATTSKAYRHIPHGMKYTFFSWCIFFGMGIGTGIAAFLMEILEKFLINYKWKACQYFLNQG